LFLFLFRSILDQTSNVSGIDDEHIYTIFVSAMEINSTNSNSITIDLLKMFTEGLNNNLCEIPQDCIEIEFDDARKTRRKLFDTNKIPTKDNSTRLYTIRLVQARKSDQTEVNYLSKKKTNLKFFCFRISHRLLVN